MHLEQQIYLKYRITFKSFGNLSVEINHQPIDFSFISASLVMCKNALLLVANSMYRKCFTSWGKCSQPYFSKNLECLTNCAMHHHCAN